MSAPHSWTPPAHLWRDEAIEAALGARDFGRVFALIRARAGVSQTVIGSLVGLPQSHVSDLERGRRHVTSLEVIERIAAGLGIPSELLGLADRRGLVDEGADRGDIRRWLQARRRLQRHRGRLSRMAMRLYPPDQEWSGTGLLRRRTWLPMAPFPIEHPGITWDASPSRPLVTGTGASSAGVRPLAPGGIPYLSYHRAVRDLDPPRLFDNRLCYRLLAVGQGDETSPMSLTLGPMSYFEMIDIGEAVAHELASVAYGDDGRPRPERARWSALPLRRRIADPFQLDRYPLLLSISTLTIRRSPTGGPTMVLSRRDPRKVAVAGGITSVVPTGVFQPAGVVPTGGVPDVDPWHSIMREFSEELLGNPEHDGAGAEVDYQGDEPFVTLESARSSGRLTCVVLGVGIDALNLVADLLTAIVIDAEVFDGLTAAHPGSNAEGTLIGLGPTDRVSFDDATVTRLLASGELAPSGAGCLAQAWRHRDLVLAHGWAA